MAQSKTLIAVALAGLMSLMSSGIAVAADKNMPATSAQMEKCYGIAKAGKNDCASQSHSCAGQSKKDMDPGEFKNVAKGTCMSMKGTLAVPK